MKTTFRFRFVWVALLLSTTLFTACKKDGTEPVAPADAATQAAGKYTYSELSYNGKTLPADQTNLKGTITVSRQTNATVMMDLNIRQKSNNDEFMVIEAEDIDVTDKGNGNLSFSYDGEEIAKLNGNKLNPQAGEQARQVRVGALIAHTINPSKAGRCSLRPNTSDKLSRMMSCTDLPSKRQVSVS